MILWETPIGVFLEGGTRTSNGRRRDREDGPARQAYRQSLASHRDTVYGSVA